MTELAYPLQPLSAPQRGMRGSRQEPVGTPRLSLVPPYAEPSCRPAGVYRRRRLVALFVLATFVVGAWSLAGMGIGLVSSRTASPATAITGQAGSSPAVPPQTWMVRPGDTLWSIARAIKPTGDIQPVLMPLISQYQGKPLTIGQVINLPASR